jgi:hypothetical protein
MTAGRWSPLRGRIALVLGALLFALATSVTLAEMVLQLNAANAVFANARRQPPHPFLQVMADEPARLNPQGFRGPPVASSRGPRSFRLFALGGSTTYGTLGDLSAAG